MTHQYTNDLINETSPYLLQHAHNPVDWKPWNDKVLQQAKDENKLILISVGYAACHWCHVMEKESFEDSLVADIMNRNFINIKVDREERPDVDQVYMNAVQLMTGSGGWPMNVVALPDGRPFWGGTYFRKDDWLRSLEQISAIYRDSPEKVIEFAENLEKGLKGLNLVVPNREKASFSAEEIKLSVGEWSKYFDHQRGGLNRAPKFMMPNNYHFLMRYAYQAENSDIMEYVNRTLTQMAYGGVYDQIGGGFSRYSVDAKWHVPHFEKMLYDNGQLVSLYSEAYLISKNELYKDIVYETLDFVKRELTNKEGAFYSSLDADSNNEEGELEEGAYYVWKKEELSKLLKGDFELFKDYYNINDYGFWEHNNFVLIRRDPDSEIAGKHGISEEDLKNKVSRWKKLLLKERDKRDRPRLDDKTLTSWNALMLKGYINAYQAFGKEDFLKTAVKNAEFLVKKQLRGDGGLNHSYKEGKSTINGYLEDYASVIDAFISLYEVTLDEKWLNTSRDLANYCFDHFFDEESEMFFFTSDEDSSLVSRSIEKTDNVIPASNSILAKDLFKLSHYFGNEKYKQVSVQMLNNMKSDIAEYGSGHSNWLDLMLNMAGDYYEIAITGKEAKSRVREINKNYVPNKLIVGSEKESKLDLLENRYVEGETFIYVCVNSACKLPVKEVPEALKQLRKSLKTTE
ncbi:DUF255 domain-containing protein [Leptobacterium flavescens]|uniref:DUF255 domain-containing protein n=1 Tax=Leptobacterium flavescens TaxID=472055 RepID=A0A6P0UJB7_9FLAO|nr:thioredoxin domain-containing protein [Leptobacterium flavescens]NER12642.1 DUF255 domain-containing protein [Leptobacterium flavescens]